jgi:hypothetical protein
MFNVVTVATKNFSPLTKRLFASLQNSRNDFHLWVFCDESDAFTSIARSRRCTVRELPEIKSIGVKRARFAVYCQALQEGSFLYLDSDVIVLKPIPELMQHSRIAGCYDDLSCVRIIPDKRHPWDGDPELENRRFINSGVFFAPRSRREFFQEILSRSRNDEMWERYGILYDNSFLCAQFNLLDEPVEYIDATVYNWQGFVVNGQLQVERRGNSLVNRRTGKVLKIAHFAGVPNPDAAMCQWPIEVSSLLSAFGSFDQASRERAFVDFLGTLSGEFDEVPEEMAPQQALSAQWRDALALIPQRSLGECGTGHSSSPAEISSLSYSLPYNGYRWNGLACGNAYLEGEEYNFLQQIIQHFGIRTAVQTGAGETSILMKSLGVDALSIEMLEGSWMERAIAKGCRCELVAFDNETRSFDDSVLRKVVAEYAPSGEFDLLFVDSPAGTYARGQVLQQISQTTKPKYVLIRDALRDARIVFECQQQLRMEFAAFLPSRRGLVLLGSRSPETARLELPAFQQDLLLNAPRFRIDLAEPADLLRAGSLEEIRVQVTNLGTETLSSRYSQPVHLSYHWLSLDSEMLVWDGLRTALPFDILPQGSAEFRAAVAMPEEAAECLLCITLLQEQVQWFDNCAAENRLIIHVRSSTDGIVLSVPPAPKSMAA